MGGRRTMRDRQSIKIPPCPPLLPSAPCAAPCVPQPQAQAAPAPRKPVPTLPSGSTAPSSSSSAAPRPHKTRVVPVRQGSVKKRDSAEQVDGGMVGGVLMPGATHAAAAGAKETHPMNLRLLFVDDEPVRTRARLGKADASVGWLGGSERCSTVAEGTLYAPTTCLDDVLLRYGVGSSGSDRSCPRESPPFSRSDRGPTLTNPGSAGRELVTAALCMCPFPLRSLHCPLTCPLQVNRSVFERMAKRIGCTVEVLSDGDEVEQALIQSLQLAPGTFAVPTTTSQTGQTGRASGAAAGGGAGGAEVRVCPSLFAERRSHFLSFLRGTGCPLVQLDWGWGLWEDWDG